MGRTPNFTTDDTQYLTAYAVGYANKSTDWIAEQVFPVAQVPDKVFQYRSYDLKNYYTIPDGMKVATMGKYPNIDDAFSVVADSTEDYAISGMIPKEDLMRAMKIRGAALNLKTWKLKALMDAMKNKYEVDVSTIVTNAANYASGFKATLTTGGTGDGYWWSDYVNSDPAAEIIYRKRQGLYDYNAFVCGDVVWWKLANHPKIVQHCKGYTTGAGSVSKEEFGQAFGFKYVLVGKARVNTAKPGKTVVLARAWTTYAAMMVIEENVQDFGGITFGYTASWQPNGIKLKIDETILEPIENGIEGGLVIGLGEHKKACLTASNLGFLWTAAVDTALV